MSQSNFATAFRGALVLQDLNDERAGVLVGRIRVEREITDAAETLIKRVFRRATDERG